MSRSELGEWRKTNTSQPSPGSPLKGSTDDADATAPKVASSEPTCPSSVSGTVMKPVPNLGPGSLFCLTVEFQFSCSVMSYSLWPHGLQHGRPPCPLPTPGACSNSCPSSRCCRPTNSTSVVLISSHLQSFPASWYFQMSQLLTSGGQRIGVSASASVIPMNIQDWFPLGLTSLISLQSNRLSRVFSNTTVQKHQLFSAQLCLWSNSHIHTWLLEKP